MCISRRIADLLDEGSFVEIDEYVEHDCTYFGVDKKRARGDGMIAGYGTIYGAFMDMTPPF